MVKLYVASIEALLDSEKFQEYFARVDKSRQKKVIKYRQRADQCRSLLAGYLLQVGVKTESGMPDKAKPLSFFYSYGSNGKPVLLNYPHIHFSISHSGNYVICAVSPTEVGADIQERKPMSERVARRFFSKQNIGLLEVSGDMKKDQLFCQLWAINEAAVKFTGKGLSQGMNQLHTSFQKQVVYELQEQGEDKPVATFLLYEELEGYVVAICGEETFTMRIEKVNIG